MNKDVILKFDQVGFSYDDKPVLENLSFELEAGKRLAVMGPSGSGKSTLLRLLLGEIRPQQGSLHWNKNHETKMAFVPQDLGLFPHWSVEKNLKFALDKKEFTQAQADLLKKYQIDLLLPKYPHEISRGQRQRVSLLRALFAKSNLFLLDEPFASLDKFLIHALIKDLYAMLDGVQTTLILVTHSLMEASFLCDKFLVLGNDTDYAFKRQDEVFNLEDNKQVSQVLDYMPSGLPKYRYQFSESSSGSTQIVKSFFTNESAVSLVRTAEGSEFFLQTDRIYPEGTQGELKQT